MQCVSYNSCGFENLELAPRFYGNLWAFDVSYAIYRNNPVPLTRKECRSIWKNLL